MAIWPTTLGPPLTSGYQVKQQEPASIRTQMESGFSRQRLRFTDIPQELTATWKWTAAQMDAFMDFYEQDIHFGNDFFEIELDTGRGWEAVDARFIAAPGQPEKQKLPGANWHFSARLEIRKIA